jgi:hypothetical protein
MAPDLLVQILSLPIQDTGIRLPMICGYRACSLRSRFDNYGCGTAPAPIDASISIVNNALISLSLPIQDTGIHLPMIYGYHACSLRSRFDNLGVVRLRRPLTSPLALLTMHLFHYPFKCNLLHDNIEYSAQFDMSKDAEWSACDI